MVKLGWSPIAAQAMLALANADQRRLVDAVGEFRWRLEQETATFAGVAQHCIRAGVYEICFRASEEGVEVQEIRRCEEGA